MNNRRYTDNDPTRTINGNRSFRKPDDRPSARFNVKNKFSAVRKVFKPREEERDTGPKPEMQIIYGKFKGKGLETLPSPKVRSTARRVREALFSTLYRRTRFSRFLDLCSGSGAVGLEAISRGAQLGTFVERSARMCSFIKKNMSAFGIKEGHGEVAEIEVVPFLKRMVKRRRVWDIVFFDPPFDSNYDEVLEIFSQGKALRKEKGILVVAHHPEMFFPEKMGILRRFRVINVPDTGTALSFYENKR
jgi:16S rRNA (guanine(966)-N(2))-methyltransferase RsmD